MIRLFIFAWLLVVTPTPNPVDGLYVETDLDLLYQQSIVSYYAEAFHGKQTACLDTFNMFELTAASPTLSCGTIVEITNIENNKSVKVRINDRGPFQMDKLGKVLRPLKPHSKRGFDLSKAAFMEIGDINKGLLKVKWRII